MTPDNTSDGSGDWNRFLIAVQCLQRRIDGAYDRRGHPEMRARYAIPLLRIDENGPTYIKDLASQAGQTHSAMSQTLTIMNSLGWVRLEVGDHAHMRVVHITAAASGLMPELRQIWQSVNESIVYAQRALPETLATLGERFEKVLLDTSFQNILPVAGPKGA